MNSKIRSGVINGSEDGPYVTALRQPMPGETQRLAGTVGAQQNTGPADSKPRHDPAFAPPQENPAVPRDEYHGKGGTYVMVDGKRVPADESGNPLPAKK